MTAEGFLSSILGEFYARMHTTAPDNYDPVRFSSDGVDRSRIFSTKMHANYMHLFAREHHAFHATWLLLGDTASRELFARLILYRLLGHHHMKIQEQVGRSVEAGMYDQASGWLAGPSPLPIRGMFGPLQSFRGVPCEDRTLDVDCWPGTVVFSFLKRQYFLQRGAVRIQPEVGETVIDMGACLGDTALAFAARVGSQGRVFAFDPLPGHVQAARHNAEQNGLSDIIRIVPKAVGDLTNNAPLLTGSTDLNPGFRIGGKEDTLPLVKLDDFVAAEGIDRVDFIKMDIEGAEMAALRGAKETIGRHRPKLAISIYHRPEDFIVIPGHLAATLPDYDFHLDHYSIHSEETVLFGLPRERRAARGFDPT